MKLINQNSKFVYGIIWYPRDKVWHPTTAHKFIAELQNKEIFMALLNIHGSNYPWHGLKIYNMINEFMLTWQAIDNVLGRNWLKGMSEVCP